MTTILNLLGILLSIITSVICSDPRDIVTYLREENFTVVVDDIQRTGLASKLQSEGPFTVFVPTDAAFAGLPVGIRSEIHNNLPELSKLIQSHVTNGILIGPIIKTGLAASTLTGRKLHFSKVPDGSVSVNGVKVIGADIIVRNGVIHSIEKVLLPATENVMEYLRSHEEDLSDVEASIYLSGLAEKLKSKGPFTMFVPTDKAFSDAKEKILPIIGNQQNLTELLNNHIIQDTLYSTDMYNGQTLATINNSTVAVSRTFDGDLYVNNCPVLRADIEVTNGVLHLTDKIMFH